MEQFGYEGPSVVGWIERDGVSGPSKGDVRVYLGSKIPNDMIVSVGCNNCTCTGGKFNCTHKICDGCEYSKWSKWTPCSKKCGNGYRQRNRNKLMKKGNEACDLPETEINDCNTDICEVLPAYSVWSPWSSCTQDIKSCVAGVRQRVRKCDSPPPNSIMRTCIGIYVDFEPCTNNCKNVTLPSIPGFETTQCLDKPHITCKDYRFNEKMAYGFECMPAYVCPGNNVLYNGQCIEPENCPCYDTNGIEWLIGSTVPSETPGHKCICKKTGLSCKVDPDACVLSTWSCWGACSTTCNKGTRTRYRKIELQGSKGSCKEKSLTESETCNLDFCPPDCEINGKFYQQNEKLHEDECTVSYCRNSKLVTKSILVVDGGFTEWSAWTTCTKTCSGIRHRTRSCSDPVPRCNGKPCQGDNSQTVTCNDNVPCCMADPWGSWEPCSVSCGTGTRKRQRNILPKKTDCELKSEETEKCNTQPCSIKCRVTQWSKWSKCKGKCGIGVRVRRRKPSKFAFDCPNLSETVQCINQCDCFNGQVWTNYSKNELTCNQRFDINQNIVKVFSPQCACPEYKNSLGECVSLEECNDCIVNGKRYKNGMIWDSEEACYKYECVSGSRIRHRICPIPTCDVDEELYQDPASPCCPRCRTKKNGSCSLRHKEDYIFSDGCVSKDKVTYGYCEGTCGNSTSMPVPYNAYENKPVKVKTDCKCCTMKFKGDKIVHFKCKNGKEKLMKLPNVCDCECKPCVDVK